MSPSDLPHISVCIPTFKRPELLDRCLEAMQAQESRGFSYSITVVDNDVEESARQVVEGWRARSSASIRYEVEPVQNISLARNRAVANARGEFIAFIDDDEFPDPTWLKEMFEACLKFSADGVLGPVVPFYEGTPPRWLVKSGLCTRESFSTGVMMNDLRQMRGGNLLFRRDISIGIPVLFDPRYGIIGGEDADFFERMLKKGRRFYWCNEAVVHEAVPKGRQSRAYHLKRAMIRGLSSADQIPPFGIGTLKSILAVIIYTLSLPVTFLVGHHHLMKYLVKDCDHLGKLLAYCGIRPVSKRTFH
ncbi:MAG: glycosyltransferase family 2 protein [Syntrophobacteraceae bacterium]